MITTALRRLLAVLTLSMAASCGHGSPCRLPPPRIDFDRTTSLLVEVADTPAARARGLMGRRHLAENRGMLFEFPAPSNAAFWMKDTLIPLSIAFYDAHRRIIAIRDMTPCRSARCRRYRSPRPFVGAVEANRGYFERHDIRSGDRFRSTVGEACL